MNFLSQFMMMSSAIIAASPADDEAVFTTPGEHTWVAPPKVRSVSVVCIGGGGSPLVSSSDFPGGGGGGLAYANDVPVVPGQSYTVIVGSGGASAGTSVNPITGEDGGDSSFDSPEITVVAYGGTKSGVGGTYFGDGGGNGGSANASQGYGGGGAGGYSGDGGSGGQGGSGSVANPGDDGTGGSSGGGGGSWAQTYTSTQPGRASSGGGTGIFGQGTSGSGGSGASSDSGLGNATPAGGGSGGTNGDLNGGAYGGGGRSGFLKTSPSNLYLAGGAGGGGVVRIIWPGNVRQFPSINTQEIQYSKMLIRIENGVPTGSPIDDKNFRQLHSNTSFPKVLTPDCVEPFGYGLYQYTKKPEAPKYMKCVEGTPIRNEQGFYIQTWETTSMSSSEIEEITVSKREEVRRIRNNKLKECDWVVISFYGDENIMTDEAVDQWKRYRKRLRDITKQPGFPWNVNWPPEPI